VAKPSCATCYVSFDHLGSVRMLTDGSGNVVARQDYLPFGEEIPADTAGRSASLLFGASDGVEQKFTGQIRDSETGMDFFPARYYESALGRFTSPDPMNAGADLLDPQSWNAYAYVRNNPLALVDPMGLCTFDAEGNAVEDENGACYEGGFGGSVTVVAQAPEDVIPIFVSLPSLLSDTQQPAQTAPPPAVTEAGGARPSTNQSPLPPQVEVCESRILNAVNDRFKTRFTTANVALMFRYSQGAPAGQGTLNLNIVVTPENGPTRVSVGRYPVNPATYVLGVGPTLHIPSGPGVSDGPLTVPFSSSQFTVHLDSAFPYNPVGLLTHLLLDIGGLGGYRPCP